VRKNNDVRGINRFEVNGQKVEAVKLTFGVGSLAMLIFLVTIAAAVGLLAVFVFGVDPSDVRQELFGIPIFTTILIGTIPSCVASLILSFKYRYKHRFALLSFWLSLSLACFVVAWVPFSVFLRYMGLL